MHNRLISIRNIMDTLNEIIDIKDEDPVKAHEMKDRLYVRLLTDISLGSEQLRKADIVELAEAALHAESIVIPVTDLNKLAKQRV